MFFIINVFIFLIQFYQKITNYFLLPSCRFYPTCSTYAELALRRFGLFKGIILILRRLLRCHPVSIGGKDFLPELFSLYNIFKK